MQTPTLKDRLIPIAAFLAVVAIVGCESERHREKENVKIAMQQECAMKGGLFVDNGWQTPAVCYAIDSIIPLKKRAHLPRTD